MIGHLICSYFLQALLWQKTQILYEIKSQILSKTKINKVEPKHLHLYNKITWKLLSKYHWQGILLLKLFCPSSFRRKTPAKPCLNISGKSLLAVIIYNWYCFKDVSTLASFLYGRHCIPVYPQTRVSGNHSPTTTTKSDAIIIIILACLHPKCVFQQLWWSMY